MCESKFSIQSASGGELNPAGAFSQQNFAVSEGPRRQSEPSLWLQDLAGTRDAAWHCWWEIYQEPDVWTNSGRRRAMLKARMVYVDAVLDYLAAAYEPESPGR